MTVSPKTKKKLRSLQPTQPMILWIVANAGGVGKTTLGVHLGFRLAQMGARVLFVDLDTNGSMARFCGLEPDINPSQSTAALFSSDFDGQYPALTPTWGIPSERGKFDVCLGGDVMLAVALDLPSRTGREFLLKRTFKKFPTGYDLVILDSPASLDAISYCALAAATHILMPLPMSIKLSGIDALLQWIRNAEDALDLEPTPKLIGGVPMRVASNADQQAFKAAIADLLAAQEIPCFEGVRYSAEFENAANRGVAPLYQYRPAHPACQDFEPIVEALIQELTRK